MTDGVAARRGGRGARVTLRMRLTAAFLLVVLVPLLLGGVLVFALLPRTVGALQGEGLQRSASLALAALGERCRRVERAAAAVVGAGAGTPAELRLVARQLVEGELVAGVVVVGPQGTPVVAEGNPPEVPATPCSENALVRTGEVAQLTATQPLRLPDGRDGGVVVTALQVDEEWVGRLDAVVGEADVVLLSDGQPVVGSGTVDDELLQAALQSPGDVVTEDGRVAAAYLRGPQSLGVLVTQRARLDLQVLQWLFPLVVVVSGVLAAAIGSGLARATTRPLEELGEAATRVADGDLTTTLAVRSSDEVGRLASAFNRMTEEVRASVQALEDSGHQLRAGVARLGEALAGTHDLDRILAVVLDTALAATGARAGAVLLRDEERGELALSLGRGLEEHGVPADLRVPVGVGISGAVARSGTALHGRSGPGRGELRPGPGEPAGVAVAAVPLTRSDAVVGVLLLWDRDGDAPFTEDDLATLRTFTSQATVAVDNVQLHEEARRLSVTDGLTGLTNYRGFSLAVGKEIERAVRFGRPLALLLLDLDHFKLVNDVWGHQRGDAVLVELAARVRAQIRDVDTLARYGGEEFVVVLPETDRAGAVQAAERIRAAVRRRPFGDDAGEPPIDVTLSLGIAVFPDHGSTSTTLLRRADEALYAAKAGGRDGWRLATEEPVTERGHRPS